MVGKSYRFEMKFLISLFVLISLTTLAGCSDDAFVASRNLTKAADNFEISRIIFYNGITDTYMLTISGLCTIEDYVIELEVTCKLGDNRYKKHFMVLSDNVTYFAEQMETVDAGIYHYRVTFKPQSILPDVDFRGSGSELLETVTGTGGGDQ